MRKCKVADLMQGRKRQTWCEEDDTHEQWRTRSAVAGSREKKKKFVDNTNLFGSGYHKTGVNNQFMPRVLHNWGKTPFVQI